MKLLNSSCVVNSGLPLILVHVQLKEDEQIRSPFPPFSEIFCFEPLLEKW